MYKFFYYVGVYATCVAIHELAQEAGRRAERKTKEKNKEAEKSKHREIGVRLNPEGKPMNKIGFIVE